MARRPRKARRSPKACPRGILELTEQGFGFVKTAEGEWFIPASKVNGAFPGDFVEVAPTSDRGGSSRSDAARSSTRKPTARVRKVLMRSQPTLIGTYEVAEPFGVVVPQDSRIPYDIFTLRADSPEVPDGSVVEVEMLEYPSRNSAATGRVVRVLGNVDDAGMDVELIIAEHNLDAAFDLAVLRQAQACTLDVEEALAQGYDDVRSAFVYTIDPIDARDYDDAVSCSFADGRYRLGVHIADVSRYVAFGSSLDLAARRRATSVYLVDRVLPMLPERISNDLCSLVPGQDRLALSVQAVVRPDGSVESFDVRPSVIRSKARLSYDQAAVLLAAENEDAALDAFRAQPEPYGAIPLGRETVACLRESVGRLHELAVLLHGCRQRAGCMDFDRVEARARLDAQGVPVGITYRRRTDATQAIEEAMILANRLVAEWLSAKGMPCVHRVHDVPAADSLAALVPVLVEMEGMRGFDKQGLIDGNPHVLQDVLGRAASASERELVSTLVLRAMKRAAYRTDDEPHYGLALQHYCHFTSPIRRYPDLLVHRMVKQALFGCEATFEAQKNSLAWMAEHSSKMESIAEKAAWDSHMLKIVEYLQGFVGQGFSGIVCGVSTFGLVVKLECTAKGLLPIGELGEEYFSFDPQRFCLTGADTGRVYRLGQRVEVVLLQAYPRQRRLRFRLRAGTDGQ